MNYKLPESRYTQLRDFSKSNPTRVVLVKLREQTDLTQSQVADEIKINRETYANYEKGLCYIPSNILVLLSQMYEVPIDLILCNSHSKYVEKFYKKEVINDKK